MAIWREEVYGTGRCINCGFLGKRSPEIDETCFHASAKDRISGIFNQHHTLAGGETNLSTIPWCFIGKADFLKELADIQATVTQNDKVREIIERDRGCSSWYPWREFATPNEHFEESMMLAMEERREKFEQQMEKDRKEFELRLDETSRQERKRTNIIMICLAVAAIIFAALQVYAALASINPDHWLFRWLR
jgi:hypothetical protein